MKYQVEVTDTFGGEANYSWVRRYEFEAPEDATRRSIITKAKRMAGWTGARCRVEDMGDMYTLQPQGECQVMFITY